MTTQELIELIAEAWLEVGAPVTIKTLAHRSSLDESTINAHVARLLMDKAFECAPGQSVDDTEGALFERWVHVGKLQGSRARTFEPRKAYLRVLLHRTRQALAKLASERQ